MRVLEAEDARGLAHERPEGLGLLRERLGRADRVVEDPVGAAVVGVGPPRDAHDGEVLRGRPCYGVEQREPADGERGDDAG